jgi:adenosylcobinamide-phosphate synthase
MHADGEALAVLIVALAVDQLAGEYPRWLHPVVWFGRAVSGLLRLAPAEWGVGSGQGRGKVGRAPSSPANLRWWSQLTFGALLAAGMTAAAVGVAAAAAHLTERLPLLQILLGAFLLKASFALRELDQAAARVERPVRQGDLSAARPALRSLCSRDPSQLDGEALLGATIESLGENASDSFLAPLFYFLLLGVPGAVGYRAVNTLDAMVGYRGRYEALGKASARLDDLANWVPARLTAGLLLLAGWLCGHDVAAGWRILRRDGASTPSPNGGRPMAVLAGLLGVRLEKKSVYVLGDERRPLTPDTVQQARRLVRLASWMIAGLCAAALVGLWRLGPVWRNGSLFSCLPLASW